jgi:hypothetical protein
MDVRDLNWKVKPAGNTLMAQIEALAEKVNVPVSRRRDIRWMSENLRSRGSKDGEEGSDRKALLGYVQTALLQGLDSLN